MFSVLSLLVLVGLVVGGIVLAIVLVSNGQKKKARMTQQYPYPPRYPPGQYPPGPPYGGQ